jgi:hypothetical protein
VIQIAPDRPVKRRLSGSHPYLSTSSTLIDAISWASATGP